MIPVDNVDGVVMWTLMSSFILTVLLFFTLFAKSIIYYVRNRKYIKRRKKFRIVKTDPNQK